MKIWDIRQTPTLIGNTHESVYRSYQILEKVKEMLIRGDSSETIIEAIEFMERLGNETKD
jgi:hypothetical protein